MTSCKVKGAVLISNTLVKQDHNLKNQIIKDHISVKQKDSHHWSKFDIIYIGFNRWLVIFIGGKNP